MVIFGSGFEAALRRSAEQLARDFPLSDPKNRATVERWFALLGRAQNRPLDNPRRP